MKKSMMGILVLAAAVTAAGGAQAQSSVSMYGNIDLGVSKKSGGTTTVGRRDNNRLGFRGAEDLGDGLKAIFQLEIRYDPDIGTIEGVSRPLFQGQSRAGLQGSFGTLRFGRGLTAFQDSSSAFEPWRGVPSTAGFQTDLTVAGYTSQPLDPSGSSANRWSNAVFYNSPEVGGAQINVTVASKEALGNSPLIGRGTAAAPQYPANSPLRSNPYSVSATYKAGPYAAMLATERNAAETKIWSVAGSVMASTALKLVASYQRQDQGATLARNPVTKAWVAGANYVMGAETFLLGYGRKQPDGAVQTKQLGLGWEHSLSTRTYLYVDAGNRKAATSVNFYGGGIFHRF